MCGTADLSSLELTVNSHLVLAGYRTLYVHKSPISANNLEVIIRTYPMLNFIQRTLTETSVILVFVKGTRLNNTLSKLIGHPTYTNGFIILLWTAIYNGSTITIDCYRIDIDDTAKHVQERMSVLNSLLSSLNVIPQIEYGIY